MPITIHTPTPNLANSLDFYTRLNYKTISAANPTLVTDGGFLIEINPDHKARPGLKFYQRSNILDMVWLEKNTKVFTVDNTKIVRDPNGVWIYLSEQSLSITNAQSSDSYGHTGNFKGVSIECIDLEFSLAFWQALGFTITMGSAESGWIALSHAEGMVVSLMKPFVCPHLFFNPSMTFFNGKENNPKCIKKIREAGIPITEEITVFNKEGIVDNIIIRDPGGYGFFVYND